MDTLKKITINNKKYYSADDLLKLNLNELEDCTNGRKILDKKNLAKRDYVFGKLKNKTWIETTGKSYKVDRVFISTKWAEDNLNKDDEIEESEENDNEDEESKEESQPPKIIQMPGLIELKKSEKMRDNEGNIIEIEIRGTRNYNNCFFLVKDVATGFGMKNLHDSIIKKNRGYTNGLHYRYFYKNPDIVLKNQKIKNNKKVKKLFLTYIGLLKVLFSSRNNTVSKFVGWATKTLFTAHLGTQEQKDKLTATLMGVSAEVVKSVFNKTSSKLPVLYLITIGQVKDLRATLNIGDEYDDEDFVAKGGETDDLSRRFGEHNKTYGEMPGAKLHLKWYTYIDPQYTKKAETELFNILGKMGNRFTHTKFEEIIIFSKKDSKIITEQYNNISRKYLGHIKEIADKLKELENQNIILQKDLDSQAKIMQKDIELSKKNSEIELLKKDAEINKLKLLLERKTGRKY